MSQRLKDLENDYVAGDINKYSKFVRVLRLALPIGILVVIAILFIWPQLSKIDNQSLTTQDINALKQAETENRLLNPTFSTSDNQNRPITITADVAIQSKSSKNKIQLSNPSAKIGNDDHMINFIASHGVYDQKSKIIILKNNVIVKDINDNILETQNLIADINKGIATSQSPAKLTTKQGIITGQSVTIDQNNQTTIFHGPAKAVINP